MLSVSTFARYLLVAAVSAFVAMALVAPAVTAHNDGFNERVIACFDSRDPDSDQCRAALEVSPVDADFFRRLADNLANVPQKREPERDADVWALVKECAATHDLESEACARAIEASGLSTEEFKEKFAAKLDKRAPKGELTPTMKQCLELKASLNGRHAHELEGMAEKVTYACRKAMVESHLTPAEFWTKYR